MLLQKHRNAADLIPAQRTADEPLEVVLAAPRGEPAGSARRVALAGFVVLAAVAVGAAWATRPVPAPPVPMAPAPVAPAYPTPEQPLMRAVFR